MNNTIYKIYTEDKNINKVKNIISGFFAGFTIYKGNGYWQGINEKSLIIEINGSKKDFKKIKTISEKIKKTNKQEAVLLTSQKIKTNLL